MMKVEMEMIVMLRVKSLRSMNPIAWKGWLTVMLNQL